MKLHTKLCIAFSMIIFLMQSLSAVIYYTYEKENFENTAVENLTAMGEKMIRQFEDYLQVMDYTLENLISNVEFMGAMTMLAEPGTLSAMNQSTLRDSLSTLTGVLYRDPLNKNFYRVNAFNRSGYFFTSRFDNRDTVNALTHDISGIVENIPWLDRADATPLERILISPYDDPWTTGATVSVFSAARSVLWLGKSTGYLEVQASAESLQEIFFPEGLDGVDVQVEVNGDALYQTRSIVDFNGALPKPGETLRKTSAEGGEELVLVCKSNKLNLSLAISQDTAQWRAFMNQIVLRLVLISIILIIASILVVTLLTFGLTKSIRLLERKIDKVDLRDVRIVSTDALATRKDDEIHRLERAFDTLLKKLNVSMQDEIRQRELNVQAHLIALQAQINPHFIYNTLNMIASKSIEKSDLEIARICEQFASMLRYSIDAGERTVPVQEELEHARNYLALLKARYEERLKFTINVSSEMHRQLLPRVSLQPLIENSIVHGYRNTTRPMELSIDGGVLEGGYFLRIADNGDGFDETTLSILNSAIQKLGRDPVKNPFGGSDQYGMGLINTFERMYVYNGGNLRIELFNENGAVVKLIFNH